MSVNIYDAANQLERDLRQTDEYKKLEKAFENLQNDADAKQLYEEFRQVQQNLQQKQMMGQEITEEETQQAQDVSTKVSENEILTGLIEAEKSVGELIDEINRIALQPIQELYQQNA